MGALGLAAAALAVPVVASAASSPPAITNFKISIKTLPPEGGSFTLSATVANAVTCTFKSSPSLPGFPATVPCSGPAGAAVAARAKGIVANKPGSGGMNPSGKPNRYTFTLSATNPTGTTRSPTRPSLSQRAYRWSRTSTTTLPLKAAPSAVSCAGARFCAVVSTSGALLAVSNAKVAASLDVGAFDDVSCASPTMCVAVDTTGGYALWNGKKWSPPTVIPFAPASGGPDLVTVSCPTTSFCVSIDSVGDAFRIHPGQGAIGLGKLKGVAGPLVSCSSAIACLVTDAAGGGFRWDGKAFASLGTLDAKGRIVALACGPGGSCTFVDDYGTSSTVNDTPLPVHIGKVDFAGPDDPSVTCPTTQFCFTADALGHAYEQVGRSWARVLPIATGDHVISLSCARGAGSPVGVTCSAITARLRYLTGVITLQR